MNELAPDVAIIEDFALDTPEKMQANEDFCKLIEAEFKASRKYWIEDTKNDYKYSRELFENKEPVDYYGLAATEDDKKTLFRSGLVNSMLKLAAATITDGRPRAFLNPVVVEGFEALLIEDLNVWQTEDPKFFAFLIERGVITKEDGQDETGQPIKKPIINDDIFLSLLNEIGDNLYQFWYEHNQIKMKNFIMVLHALLFKKSYQKVRANRQGNDIIQENLPTDMVGEDHLAVSREDRRYIWHAKSLQPHTVEAMFDLPAGSIQPDSAVSEYDNDENVKTAMVQVVEMYWRNDRKGKDGEFLYPNGQQITFICGQKQRFGMLRFVEADKWKYGSWPICDYIYDPITAIEGIPMAQHLGTFQENIDKAIQMALANAHLFGMQSMTYEEGALIDPESATNIPGRKIPVTHLGGVQINPAQPSIEAGMALANTILMYSKLQTGLSDAAQGAVPTTTVSGRLYDKALMSSQLRFRPAQLFYVMSLIDHAMMWGYFALDIYKKGDKYRTGKTFQHQRTLPFDLSRYIAAWDVYIAEDSTLSRDKASQAQFAMQVVQTPPQSAAALEMSLDIMQIENAPDILAAFKKELDTNAKLQQLATMLEQAKEQLQAEMAENEKLKQDSMDGMMKVAVERIKQETAQNVEASRAADRKNQMAVQMDEADKQRSHEQFLTDIEGTLELIKQHLQIQGQKEIGGTASPDKKPSSEPASEPE